MNDEQKEEASGFPPDRPTERSPALLESLLECERGVHRAEERKAAVRLELLGAAIDLCVEISAHREALQLSHDVCHDLDRLLEKAEAAGIAARIGTGWRRVHGLR